MFELQHPLWLLALLLLPALALRERGGRARLGWSALSRLREGRGWRVALAWLPSALRLLGLAALIVALARPQLTHREVVVRSDGIDIMLALDTSGSMEALDFVIDGQQATRLDVAREVMAEFIQRRPYDRLGLVVFGEEAFTQVPLTLDEDSLLRFLSQVEIGMAGGNATAVGQALAVASARLAELDAPSKVVILLTDGRSNAGKLSPMQAAEVARSLGIKVYTIGVGSHEGPSRGIFGLLRGGGREQIDERTLTRMAELTGAQYFRATDTDSLREIYDTIDKLEKTTAEAKEYVHREELYRYALLPGLALLALQQLLVATVLRRLP
ncbi:MAG: VWA domain-containing protein [Alphaproteobacteria bacterium]|nr:VWA domain-containing protein [Alphaproteobacteria bacterium]